MTPERWNEVKSILAAVLETDDSQRQAAMDRLCGGDAELRRDVASLLAYEARADAELDSAGAPGAILREEAPPPESIGPYRLVREIGRGGMGVVYLGERADGNFTKQVAVKLITGARRDAGLERRFRRERQILASLEHPGIARLLDGGTTETGQPYFIMEYIEGLPLLDYCDRRRLGVSARLRLFLDICDAVGYAHHRLIVHRDLKPGNVLVTQAGVAKLLDFGLGQVLGGDAADDQITQVGPPPMTPAYASPEQIRGEAYTVTSDVYSLGVILYELLAGKRPHAPTTGSYLEMAKAICEHEPEALGAAAGAISPEAAQQRDSTPERLRRRCRGDLEKISAKALAKDAALRYATVDDLAADLRRHLEGRPVRARSATLRYRAEKLLRRHRVAAPASALAVLLILGFAGFARRQQVRAERRFEQVRRLANSVMFELHDAIAELPGSTAARELLIRRALEYLESLSHEAGADRELAREVALGYYRIGEVQGDVADANLGHLPASLESFRKAAQILEGLVAKWPSDHDLAHDYLRVTIQLATAYGHAGKFDAAMAMARRNVSYAESAASQSASDLRALVDLEAAAAGLADLLTDQHQYEQAIVLRERVEQLARRISAAQPGDAQSERSVAVAEKRLAALFGVTGRMEECRKRYELARQIDERRCAASPADMRAKVDLSYDYSDLGWAAGVMNDPEAALAFYRRALDLRQQAADADPRNVRAAQGVATSTWRIGTVLRRMGRLHESLAELQRASALFETLTHGRPADWTTIKSMADVHADLAALWLAMVPPDREKAAAEYGHARRLMADLRDRGLMPKAEFGRVEELAALEAKARAPR